MYLNKQILPLIALIEAIDLSADDTGCSDDLTVASRSAIEKAVAMARALESGARELVIGAHDHRHGPSLHAFAVAAGSGFDDNEFQEFLGELYEPERDESTSLTPVKEDDITAIDPLPPVSPSGAE